MKFVRILLSILAGLLLLAGIAQAQIGTNPPIENNSWDGGTLTNDQGVYHFNSYMSKSCAGPSITATIAANIAGLSVVTDFGDGTVVTSSMLPNTSFNARYASLSHSYQAIGTYVITQIFYAGSNPIDTIQMSYTHAFCSTMSVQLFNDVNNNCLLDTGVDHSIFLPVLVEVDSNNVAIDLLSCTNGFVYSAFGNAGDIYKFKILSLPGGMMTSCPVSGIISDTVQGGINPVRSIGFACVNSTVFDYGVNVDIPVTGPNDQWGNIYVTNEHCYGPNATLTLQHSPKYHFMGGAQPAPSSYGNNTLTWNLSNVTSNTTGPARIYFVVWKASGQPLLANDTVHNRIQINPTNGDSNPVDNSMIVIDTVQASQDPNAIYVKPEGCVAAGTNLEYTITFENIGNAPAENIYVLDTLPAGVDAGSMRLKFASHNMYVEKVYNGAQVILKFNFPNIMLPDSSDHAGCHGTFSYTIDSKSALPYGASIDHRAGIYFDYNDPVMTNTAQTEICWPAHVSESISSESNILIYPNPATEELTIKTGKRFTSYIITNRIGQVVMNNTLIYEGTRLNIKSLTTGIYYIRLEGEGGAEVRKFVKM